MKGRIAATPFLIAASPVMLIMSVFTLVSFGFYIAMNSLTPVFLQKPEKIGGYGFTTLQNAYFSFVHWIGIGIALIYGHLISDRLPLAIAARNGGIWKPEYRLHALWLPALVMNPIGLGIFGAALEYHLSWVVIAVGQVMVTFGSLSIIPITVNYICVRIILRLGFGSLRLIISTGMLHHTPSRSQYHSQRLPSSIRSLSCILHQQLGCGC
jgi:hypothetical protein